MSRQATAALIQPGDLHAGRLWYCAEWVSCACSHLVQIVLDSLLVSWWNRRDADGSTLDHLKDAVCDNSVLVAEHNHS